MKYKSPISNKTSSQTRPATSHHDQTPSRSPLTKISRLSPPPVPLQKNNNSRDKTPETNISARAADSAKSSNIKTPENLKTGSLRHPEKTVKRLETTPIRGASSKVKHLNVESPILYSGSQKSSESSVEPPQPGSVEAAIESPKFDLSEFSSSYLFTPKKGNTQASFELFWAWLLIIIFYFDLSDEE